ncbi:hypothetical protein EIP91_009352 [Steccherinum ochraceum]|uniref:Uncharacterized protein n=1 Tax=Steccherinum ochraceum TaxID=92696 RepID=A0A4R0RP68_9APHY|nr:hypothetical protein EIP91_009352 [Steccherinum ochraceum]
MKVFFFAVLAVVVVVVSGLPAIQVKRDEDNSLSSYADEGIDIPFNHLNYGGRA